MHCNCRVGVNISNIIINITRWLAREKDQTQNYILQFPHHPQPTQTKHVPSFHIHIPFAIFHTTKEKTWWDCGRTGGLNVRLKFIFFFSLTSSMDNKLINGQQAIEDAKGVTSTAVFPVIGCTFAAAFSSCSHICFRFFASNASFASSSLKCAWQDRNNSSSISMNIFLTLRVRFTTAWFQWLCAFFSNAGSMIGNITCRLCPIKFTMWSLFHKKRDLSAT